MDELFRKLGEYGPLGVVLALMLGVAIYVIIKGRIKFEYPRPGKKS